MTISKGGGWKSPKVHKPGGGCNKRGIGKISKVNVYGVSCYRWRWREGKHTHWIKNVIKFFEKELITYFLTYCECLSSPFIISSS